ncbi:MAG TPA: ATP-binding protein [Terriglobia bacterium]|nr:ATP-binding protein [Terriglobia bacterium]
MSKLKHVPPAFEFESDRLALKIDEAVPSDPGTIEMRVDRIMALIRQTACCDGLDQIELALEEALANAIIHGNGGASTKAVRVCVAVREDCEIFIAVKDAGSGFQPDALPDPTAAKNLLAGHGRGIFIMKQLMEEVRFEFDDGTTVYMRKRGRT